MSIGFVIAVFLAVFWGIAWAMALQFTRWGRWLVLRRTWLSVVVGVGVDLLIVAAFLPFEEWLRLVAVIALSSLGLVFRSIHNEHKEEAS